MTFLLRKGNDGNGSSTNTSITVSYLPFDDAFYYFYPSELAIDLLVVTFFVLLCSTACYKRIRRSPTNYSLRSLVIIVSLVAAFCGMVTLTRLDPIAASDWVLWLLPVLSAAYLIWNYLYASAHHPGD